ncbi:hypothetical protein WMY93_028474 [Mugilogobius chulae]|uniref:L1 transposable element RRM domain-containing protein n=1 Tax=Mugilogobius chulae TaxID=88201 RepID=A0AAW0MQC9_9GOBI
MNAPSKTRLASKQGTLKEKDDKKQGSSRSASVSSDASATSIDNGNDDQLASEQSLLEELKKLRRENTQGHNQTKESLDRLEKAVSDIKEQLTDHEQRIGELEVRVNTVEDTEAKQHRVLRYLLQQGSEGGNMTAFVKDLLPKVLTLPPGLDIRIERAHRSLQSKPTNPAAAPRSILVRFLDAAVKDVVLQQAWKQGQVSFQDKRIFFDQDYSPELQKKRSKVHVIVKQLKQMGIQAKCLYPARLRVKMDSGEKTFASLTSASDTLEGLGVRVICGEKERIEERLTEGWSIGSKRSRDGMLSTADLKAIVEEED